eukprot:scaffold12973_cov117-Isochrysis_galbana.AAC.5
MAIASRTHAPASDHTAQSRRESAGSRSAACTRCAAAVPLVDSLAARRTSRSVCSVVRSVTLSPALIRRSYATRSSARVPLHTSPTPAVCTSDVTSSACGGDRPSDSRAPLTVRKVFTSSLCSKITASTRSAATGARTSRLKATCDARIKAICTIHAVI